MRELLLALIVAVFAFSQAEAQGTYAIYGVGKNSCGMWLEGRDKFAGKSAVPVSETGALAVTDAGALAVTRMREQWVIGYVSAFNLWGPWPEGWPEVRDIGKGTDEAGMLVWIDNWCRDNPLEQVASATEVLIGHLRERQGFLIAGQTPNL